MNTGPGLVSANFMPSWWQWREIVHTDLPCRELIM